MGTAYGKSHTRGSCPHPVLAFDLLKEAEEFRTGEHVPPDKWDAMKSLVNEKRRVATQLNDIIEEDGQS